MTEYIELHAHSAFSFLEGASSPEEMAAVCAELGMPAIALLDANGIYGAPRLHMAMNRLGLRGIVGSDVAVEKFGCAPFARLREPARLDPSLGKNKSASLRMTTSLPLLVETAARPETCQAGRMCCDGGRVARARGGISVPDRR